MFSFLSFRLADFPMQSVEVDLTLIVCYGELTAKIKGFARLGKVLR